MATVTRTTTWSDGQVLSAAALNGEFNNALNALSLVNADISGSAAIVASKISGTAATLAGPNTMTNTTITKRVQTAADATSIDVNSDNYDL
jgi:hypothetical protein